MFPVDTLPEGEVGWEEPCSILSCSLTLEAIVQKIPLLWINTCPFICSSYVTLSNPPPPPASYMIHNHPHTLTRRRPFIRSKMSRYQWFEGDDCDHHYHHPHHHHHHYSCHQQQHRHQHKHHYNHHLRRAMNTNELPTIVYHLAILPWGNQQEGDAKKKKKRSVCMGERERER